jgi:hypothetical protein
MPSPLFPKVSAVTSRQDEPLLAQSHPSPSPRKLPCHPEARANDEFEIGSIGIQQAAGSLYFWAWAIDTVIPMRTHETRGKGKDRRDCMRQFKAAWERFAGDEANLVEFLNMKWRRR